MINLLLAVWLAWDPSSGAWGYRLYYGPKSGVQSIFEDTGDKTTWQVTGLPVGVPIYFVVRAYNAVGESGPSDEVVWIEPLPTPTPMPTPTATPTPTPSPTATPRPRGHSGKPPK